MFGVLSSHVYLQWSSKTWRVSLTDSQARTDLPAKGARAGQLGACLGRGGRARSAATAFDFSAALIQRSGRAHLHSAPATSEALRL